MNRLPSILGARTLCLGALAAFVAAGAANPVRAQSSTTDQPSTYQDSFGHTQLAISVNLIGRDSQDNHVCIVGGPDANCQLQVQNNAIAAAGAYADGALATLGYTTDSAWSGSGSCTAIACWKAADQYLSALVNGLSNVPPVTPQGIATGAATDFGFVTTTSTNATLIGTAGVHTVYGLGCFNTTTTIAYLRVYDLGVAPTPSSATGFLYSIPCAPASASGLVGGETIPIGAVGVKRANGLAFAVTGGGGSTDNTAAPAGVYVYGSAFGSPF
jgi:hypothetical protein